MREHVDQGEQCEGNTEQPGEYILSHDDLRKHPRGVPFAMATAEAPMQEAHHARAPDARRMRMDPASRFPRDGKDFPCLRRNGPAPVSVSALHCAACGAEFVDSRPTVVDGDEARCPKCGARYALTPGSAEAKRRDDAKIDPSARLARREVESNEGD